MAVLNRRHFLATAGAVVVTFRLAPLAAQGNDAPALPRFMAADPALDSWLRVDADGAVTVFTGKAELGQGVKTALIQIAAEELDLPLERVTLLSADTRHTPNEAYTAGSRSIEDSGAALRLAAAEAARLLRGFAAEDFGTDADQLTLADGRVHAPDGRSAGYGELVRDRSMSRPVSGDAPLKSRDDYRLVGRSVPRVDLPAKVYGGVAFIQDLRLDGMLHARIVHPPGQRARLAEVDKRPVERMRGVHAVLHDGSLLGVIATREEQAIAAAAELARRARWDEQSIDLPDDDSLETWLRAFDARRSTLAERGEPAEGGRRVSATYLRPFQAHASMGPSCAVAVFDDERLTVWSHTQGVYPLREEMARVLRTAVENIDIIHMENAGCYGQNGADDAAMEAALLARLAPGRPVRLQWSREDESAFEPLGAPMLMDCEARLDDDGRVADWHFTVRGLPNTSRPNFGGGDGANLLAAQLMARSLPPRELTNVGLARNAVPLYDFPTLRVHEEFIAEAPVRVSSLRALGGYANVFALESFVDELAAAAGTDPVAFRLAHLEDPRGRAVIRAVAEASDWANRDGLAEGRGLGVAFACYNNNSTYCAMVADVEVADSGAVRVHKLWSATECGLIINPDGVRNQIAGGAIQSASWTLKEAVRFNDGGPRRGGWADYPILRFDEAPDVEVVLIDRPDLPSVGAGEASQGPTAAAVANAVYAATGARVRQLPLTPERVSAARG